MGKAAWTDKIAPLLIESVPVCQWGFNKSRHFVYVSGNADIFGRQPEELLHQHVSLIEDSSGAWAARLDQIFSGTSPYHAGGPTEDQNYVILHVPIHATDGSIAYAAGFSFTAGNPPPSARELELAALSILQVLRTERTRTERFLHDVVAQCLSSTGLQLELLRLEIEDHQMQTPSRAADIQNALVEALSRIRTFNARQDVETA
jgi:signal transduction histidine kinase